ASIPLYRKAGDETGALWALAELASAVALEDHAAGRAFYEEGMIQARAAGADGPLYSMEYGYALFLSWIGFLDEARRRFAEVGSHRAPAEHFRQWAHVGDAMCAVLLGEVNEARALVENDIMYARAADDMMVLCPGMMTLALVHTLAGELEEARAPM